MTAEATGKLEPGAIVEGRFKVEEALPESPAYLGTDQETNARVVFLPVPEAHAKALEPARGVSHQHLAAVLHVGTCGGEHVVVAEYVPGQTLERRLIEIKKKSPVDAVRNALRVADVLTSLHEHHTVHGMLHPRALVVEPESRTAAPVLAFMPGAGEPLRAPGGSLEAPTVADDAWGAGGLLHWMLTGSSPPSEGYESDGPLADAGVSDEALRVALYHSLAKDIAVRSKDMRPLRRELARWFVDHAAEESIPPGRHSREPPPFPPSDPSTLAGSSAPKSSSVSGTTSPVAKKRKSNHLGAFAVTGIGLGLIGGWVISSLKPKPSEVQLVPKVAATTATADPGIQLTDVPVTADSERLMGDSLTTCAASYLPKGTFGKAPDFEFLCKSTDPREGAEKLRVAIVGSAPKGAGPSDAMKIFARIGWYDMAALAVLRTGCCPDAPPLKIEGLASTCTQMDAALEAVGKAVVDQRPTEAPLKSYTDAIHCELNLGHGTLLKRAARPVGGEDSAFLEMVKKLEK